VSRDGGSCLKRFVAKFIFDRSRREEDEWLDTGECLFLGAPDPLSMGSERRGGSECVVGQVIVRNRGKLEVESQSGWTYYLGP
jgi:hypothetical protein